MITPENSYLLLWGIGILAIICMVLLVWGYYPIIKRILPILTKAHLRWREPLKLIDSFPRDNEPITTEDIKRIFLKFNKPIDKGTEGLIGNYYIKANAWCQWNIGGWIQYAEDDTKLIWHINGDPQNNKDWFGPMETDYPTFEIRIPNSSQSPRLRATDGSELPRTIIRAKIRAESRKEPHVNDILS